MTPQRILIFGRGQLGTFYKTHFGKSGASVSTPVGDIRDGHFVANAVRSFRPDLIVNCAAKTNIDWCEMHRTECFEVNVLGADTIGKVAEEEGVRLLHISSGCVQESASADEVRGEEDAPHPLCYYAWTKVWAENLLTERALRGSLDLLILRPRQLLSSMVSPRNALVKMLTYTRFVDTPNSCTVVEDLMDVTSALLAKDAKGLYNVVNPGVTSPYRIAELLKTHLRPGMEFERISKDELNAMTLAKRIDAVLSTEKLEAQGIALRPIEERLVEILAELKANLESGDAEEALSRTKEETDAKLALVK